MLGFLAAAIPAVVGGVMGASQQASRDRAAENAAKEQNKLQEEQAKKVFARAQEEYELDWQRNLTKFFWEQAGVEQARFVQAQGASDQARSNGRLIYGVAQSYLNMADGLRAQYVDSELMRGKQEMNKVGQEVSQAALNNRKLLAQTQQETARYLMSVVDNSYQARGLVDQVEGEVDKIMTELTTAEMTANFEFNASVIAAAMDYSAQANVALTASGGGQSAKMLAQNGMKRALMEYGKVQLARQQRSAQVGQLNAKITGEMATRLQGLAAQSANYVQQSQLAIGQGGIAVAANMDQMAWSLKNFNDLTIPSFKLANDQYKRELRTLQLGVSDQLYNATLPIRQTQYFDPLRPIKGLPPTLEVPTPVRAQTGGFLGTASAALQGAQALSPSLFNTIIPNALGSLFQPRPAAPVGGTFGGGGTGANWANPGVNWSIS